MKIENFEKKHKITLPLEYKKFYSCCNNYKSAIYIGDDIYKIKRFFNIDEIDDILEKYFDLFGYDIVPIILLDDEDLICFLYKEAKNNPSVIYWNYELFIDNTLDGITCLFDSFEELENYITFK